MGNGHPPPVGRQREACSIGDVAFRTGGDAFSVEPQEPPLSWLAGLVDEYRARRGERGPFRDVARDLLDAANRTRLAEQAAPPVIELLRGERRSTRDEQTAAGEGGRATAVHDCRGLAGVEISDVGCAGAVLYVTRQENETSSVGQELR